MSTPGTLTMAAAPGTTEMEEVFLLACHAKQAEKVRETEMAVEQGRATKAEADAEVAKLLEIKAEYKMMTGRDPAPPGADSEAAAGAPVDAAVAPTPAPAPAPRDDVIMMPRDTPNPAIFLDIYPTGSNGHGLPMCVTSKYREQIESRDTTDSGFDLYTPAGVVVPPHKTVRVKLGVQATVRSVFTFYNHHHNRTEAIVATGRRKPYWLAPRSSISKTPLILANSMGVVDAGYNGELMAAFHNTSDEPYEIEQFQRLIQIVTGDLTPPHRITLRGQTERPDRTARGAGGFGSTGK